MVVIDANAALEMAFEGERGDALRDLLLQGEEAIAPSVFHSEVSNACSKYAAFGSMGEEKAQVLLDRVEALVDCFHGRRVAREGGALRINSLSAPRIRHVLSGSRPSDRCDAFHSRQKDVGACARHACELHRGGGSGGSDRVAVLRSTAPHFPLPLTSSLQQSVLCPVNCPKQFAVSLISVG